MLNLLKKQTAILLAASLATDALWAVAPRTSPTISPRATPSLFDAQTLSFSGMARYPGAGFYNRQGTYRLSFQLRPHQRLSNDPTNSGDFQGTAVSVRINQDQKMALEAIQERAKSLLTFLASGSASTQAEIVEQITIYWKDVKDLGIFTLPVLLQRNLIDGLASQSNEILMPHRLLVYHDPGEEKVTLALYKIEERKVLKGLHNSWAIGVRRVWEKTELSQHAFNSHLDQHVIYDLDAIDAYIDPIIEDRKVIELENPVIDAADLDWLGVWFFALAVTRMRPGEIKNRYIDLVISHEAAHIQRQFAQVPQAQEEHEELLAELYSMVASSPLMALSRLVKFAEEGRPRGTLFVSTIFQSQDKNVWVRELREQAASLYADPAKVEEFESHLTEVALSLLHQIEDQLPGGRILDPQMPLKESIPAWRYLLDNVQDELHRLVETLDLGVQGAYRLVETGSTARGTAHRAVPDLDLALLFETPAGLQAFWDRWNDHIRPRFEEMLARQGYTLVNSHANFRNGTGILWNLRVQKGRDLPVVIQITIGRDDILASDYMADQLLQWERLGGTREAYRREVGLMKILLDNVLHAYEKRRNRLGIGGWGAEQLILQSGGLLPGGQVHQWLERGSFDAAMRWIAREAHDQEGHLLSREKALQRFMIFDPISGGNLADNFSNTAWKRVANAARKYVARGKTSIAPEELKKLKYTVEDALLYSDRPYAAEVISRRPLAELQKMVAEQLNEPVFVESVAPGRYFIFFTKSLTRFKRLQIRRRTGIRIQPTVSRQEVQKQVLKRQFPTALFIFSVLSHLWQGPSEANRPGSFLTAA